MRFLLPLLIGLSSYGQIPVTPWVIPTATSAVLPTANTILWCDSVSGSTFRNSSGSTSPSNGDKIEAYSDLTVNHFNLTNSGASTIMPTYNTAGGPPANNPYLAFAQTQGMSLSNSFNGTTFAQPVTMYFILNQNLGGVTEEVFDSFNSSAREVWYFTTGGGGDAFIFAGQNSASVAGHIPALAWTEVTFQFNGASSLIRTNGVAEQSGLNPGAQGLDGFVMSNRFDGATPSDTKYAAVVINNAADSTTVMHQIEVFLGGEYGVTIH